MLSSYLVSLYISAAVLAFGAYQLYRWRKLPKSERHKAEVIGRLVASIVLVWMISSFCSFFATYAFAAKPDHSYRSLWYWLDVVLQFVRLGLVGCTVLQLLLAWRERADKQDTDNPVYGG